MLTLDYNKIADYSGQNGSRTIAYHLGVKSVSGSLFRGESPMPSYVPGTAEFGRLYVNKDSYAIAWNGYLDFNDLQELAIRELGDCVISGLKGDLSESEFDFSNTSSEPSLQFIETLKVSLIEKVKVSLIVAGEMDELIEYEIYYESYPKETFKRSSVSKRAMQVLRSPEIIAFARFDVTVAKRHRRVLYSFTAEKTYDVSPATGELKDKGDVEEHLHVGSFATLLGKLHAAEMGLRLPTTYLLDSVVLRWILRCHPLSARSITQSELDGFVKTLRTLIDFDPGGSSPPGGFGPKNHGSSDSGKYKTR